MGYEFDLGFQKLLIKHIIEKKKLSYVNLLFPKIFEDSVIEIIFRYIKKYYKEKKNLPSYDEMRRNAGGLFDIGMEQNLPETKPKIIEMIDQIEYISDINEGEIEKQIYDFIKIKKSDKLFMEMLDDRARGEYQLDKYIGVLNKIRSFEEEDPDMDYYKARNIEKYFEKQEAIKTGFDTLDKRLDGGLQLGELGLVVGETGIGKTFFMLNMAAYAYMLGYDVIYITLEIEDITLKRRLDSRITGMGWGEIIEDKEKYIRIMDEKHNGNLIIVPFYGKGCSVEDIREKVLRLRNEKTEGEKPFNPKLLIIDFIENMAEGEEKSSWEKYEGLGRASVQLRKLAQEQKMAVWIVQQIQRQGFKAKTVKMENIQSSIKIVSIIDVFVSINWAEEKLPSIRKIHIDKLRRTAMPDKDFMIRFSGNRSLMEEMSFNEFKKTKKEKKEEEE